MFDGFADHEVQTGRGRVFARVGGEGPPLLLLHGYPQTHLMWHSTAPLLTGRHTVVVADLPGYGASFRPTPTPDHTAHSKRALAVDLVEAMAVLGHDRFAVAGHDRGGRVAYRMALDHPDRVRAAAVLDVVPTGEADVLRDEGEAYAAKLRAAGVPVTAVRYQGIIHDFVMLNALRETHAAQTAITLATGTLRTALHAG